MSQDPGLLERVCSEAEQQLAKQVKDSPAVLRSFLTSLGQLQLHQPRLLERLLERYQTRLEAGERPNTKEVLAIVLTCATLNHRPSQPDLLQRLTAGLERGSGGLTDPVWLDLVWSLALLGQASPAHFQSVLCPAFAARLTDGAATLSVGPALKLLNVNAAARLLTPDYPGPLLSLEEEPQLRAVAALPSLAKAQFSTSLLEALNTLAPPPRLSRAAVNTGLGCSLEAELVCDSGGRTLAVADYSEERGKPLPAGAVRVALMTASYQDCLVGGDLAGLTQFNRKLVEAAGYRVLLVRHTEWQQAADLPARQDLYLVSDLRTPTLRLALLTGPVKAVQQTTPIIVGLSGRPGIFICIQTIQYSNKKMISVWWQ